MAEILCAFNMTQQSFVGLRVGRADTMFKRLRGLLGRARLACDEGLWMVPSQGIHTIGLTFPMDLIYLDEDCQVVHIVEHLAPFRIAPLKIKAHTVLELAARAVHSSGTKIGDRLLICSPETLKARWEELKLAVRS